MIKRIILSLCYILLQLIISHLYYLQNVIDQTLDFCLGSATQNVEIKKLIGCLQQRMKECDRPDRELTFVIK